MIEATGMRCGSFGDYLRSRREAASMSLRKLAAHLGLSPSYLSQVERGKCAPPSEDAIKKCAALLLIDCDDLLARSGRIPSDVLDILRRNPVEAAKLLRSWHSGSKSDNHRVA